MSGNEVARAKRTRWLGLTTSALTIVGLAVVGVGTALPASADTPSTVSPVVQRSASNVTADALPTVQLDNGVVWSETTVGNTVYAGGQFSNVRPAGAAAGTNLTARGNLLAFDITTGNLVTSFAPNLNGMVKVVAASPDGKTLYVGGSFTTANGATRNKVVAYNTVTGAVVGTFAPSVNLTVNSIVATATTVYLGGDFTQVNGQNRSHLAAVNASDGSLTAWAPTADATVQTMVLSPDGTRLIVGGAFQNLNGAPAYGLGSLDPTSAVLYPFAANQVVRDAGANAQILSLTTDGTYVYSSAYVYGSSGNFEGVLSADPDTGAIHWLADCHGDTYATFGVNNIVYVVSHQHFCSNIGGFPDTNPRNIWHRTTAFTQAATGTVQPNSEGGYSDFSGNPSPSLIDWMPDLAAGTYTQTDQAAWAMTGNSKYLVEGGEFPSVNGTAQYGLVRFATPAVTTDQQGPMLYGSAITPIVIARSSTSARITWPSNWDRDDLNLTYTIRRSDKGSTPIYSVVAPSESWNLPTQGFTDTGLTPGATYSYTVRATDPSSGKYQGSASVSVTLPLTAATDSQYTKDVLGAGATDYWKLDQAAGATSNIDYAGYHDLTLGSGVTGGGAGAISGDSDTASSFDGSASGFGASNGSVPGPNTFTEEAWFKTTSTAGGKIVGFGDQNTGTSSNYDRHVYMDTGGHINFGVYNNTSYVITSPGVYNDGAYHQVVASLSGSGMALYVDGRLVGTNTGTTVGQPYNGYWRVGGDSSWSGANFFTGTIDEVAIYPTALTAAQIRQQYADSGRAIAGTRVPSDSYGAAVWNLSPSAYYRLDETTGNTATDLSGNSANATYSGNVTRAAASTVSGGDTAAGFDGSSATVGSNDLVASPQTYSEQAWFKTTSTAGGKIIGFGNSQSGNSGSYDRHVYMLADGQLVFGTYTGQLNLATSPHSYNDGTWHSVTATQGVDGMTLYVDGQAVATNAQTSAQSYNGYWRIGGDNLNGWNADNAYFSGSIDEAAFWNTTELTAAQILSEYSASPAAVRVGPTAAFVATPTNLSVAFDASGSSGQAGTSIMGYRWDFGDGTSGTGVSPSHSYASASSYTVTLTVTDSNAQTGTISHSVTTTAPNVAPSAAFTAVPTNLSVAFDGSASSAQTGATITSYSWDFGDGSFDTGAKPVHVYGAAGTFQVRLTVTDSNGLTSSVTHSVTTIAANKAPVAAFTSSVTNLSVAFDASTSSDPDGSVSSYAWDFGDGTSGTGVNPTHVFTKAGSYTVVLTVTDNAGATTSISHVVTPNVAANQPPVAAFASAVSNLSVTFDGSGSSDPDGTVASYAWTFGDGTTGSGATPTHQYAAAATYNVTLMVTDNQGATNSIIKAITTTAAAASIAADAFGRTAAGQWGTADTGGAWTTTGSASLFAVDGSSGTMNLSVPGTALVASLNSVSTANLNAVADISVNATAVGNGVALTMIGRQVGKSNYELKIRLLPGGVVHLTLSKVISGTETIFKEVNISGLTYNVGDVLRFRFQIVGTGTATLSGKVWKLGTTEPTAAQITQTDSTAALQSAGSFALQAFLSGSSTNPMIVKWDNLQVTSS